MTAIRIAWRNIWRNRRRTAITLVAVTLNTAFLIFTFCLTKGFVADTVDNATNIVVGEEQIHAEGYLKDRSIYKSLEGPAALVAEADRLGVAAAPRSFGYGLASSGKKSAGAMFWGVRPERERKAFDMYRQMESGGFLPDKPGMGVVLGRKLAKSLNATVGSEIVVVVQAADGSLGNELYTVTGILKGIGDVVDRSAAILHADDFEELFVSGGRVHEIALNGRGTVPLEDLRRKLQAVSPESEIKTWMELLPMLADMIRIIDSVMLIFSLVFYCAAGLGLMNTMLMAAYERFREFGMLKALGTTPFRIVRDVATEALVLSLLAAAAGAVLGTLISLYLQKNGINLAAFTEEQATFSGIAFNSVWRTRLELKSVLLPTLLMPVICLLSALYPAILAARKSPVEAMRHQ